MNLPFNIITKPIGPICNLDCTYCFYLEKENLYPAKTSFKMSDDVLENYVRQYIEAQPGNHVSFVWQGGEPTLLGLDFFKKAVELQNKYKGFKNVENAFQTNGVLLDDNWGRFLYENNFLVGLSIDGPEKIHDYYRPDKGGKGSFKKVMKGLDFLKKNRVEFNTLTVVQRHNSEFPLEVYNFLKDIESRFMQFIPIVERISPATENQPNLKLLSPSYKNEAHVSDWSVLPDQYGIFLKTIFDKWVRNDVGEYFVQIFDVALNVWCGLQAPICIFNEECGRALAIEHNGDLYSCDHYVYPENMLGNIMENPLLAMVNNKQQVKFGTDKKDTLPKYCRECEVRFICNGECPKHRFIETPDGEEGLNYLCAGYKMFFNYINPYMKFMADELKHRRPPANVMAWTKEKDAGFPSLKTGANDPCPCRSGIKYKKCCGAVKSIKHVIDSRK